MANPPQHLPNNDRNESISRKCEKRDMDEILEAIGPFSVLQVVIHISMFYIQIAINCHTILSFFAGHSPSWRCTANSNASFCLKNPNKTFTADDHDFSRRCDLNRSQWTYSTFSAHSFVTEFDLICSKTSVAALINSCFFIGCLAGAIVAGPIGDRFGRKIVIIVSSIILPIPCVASGYVTSVWQLCAANVLRGIASTGCMYTPYVYLSEVSPPSYRSLSINISNLMVCVSFLLLDAMAYQANNWRHLFIYSGLLVIPLWGVLYFLPESPRWLVAKGRMEEASIVLGKLSNCRSKQGNISISVAEAQNVQTKEYSYIDLFRNCKVLITVVKILVIWAFLPSLYYSISIQSMNLGGNMYEDYALSTLMDIPAFFVASFLNSRIGRKKTNMLGSIVAGLFIGSVALVPASSTNKHTISMVLSSLARLGAGVGFYAMYLWTSELFPTVIRAQGLSFSATIEKLGMISIPFVTDLLKDVNYHLPFIFMCVTGGVVAVAGLGLPETHRMPTRESYEDFFLQSGSGHGITSRDATTKSVRENKVAPIPEGRHHIAEIN